MSREAIAEFQIVTNMYDITQGRSTGVQVQAVSRAGTNDLHGSAFGFFRSDKFNAADPVKNVVLPYSDQQTGFTLGGPVMRDKVHFFGSYEYERNPSTAVLTPTALPNQTWSLPSNTIQNNYLARGDYQQSAKNNFSVRSAALDSSTARSRSRAAPRIRRWPSTSATTRPTSTATWTRVPINNTMTMQVHGGTVAVLVVRRPDPVEHDAVLSTGRSVCRCSSSRTCRWAGSRTSRTTRG